MPNAGTRSILLLVAILAALAPLSLRTENATYAQTESAAALPAPTLTAEAKGANAVELTWTAVAGAARYNLALYTVADGHQRFDDVVAPATTFTHPDLTTGRTYYYWVRAVTASGQEGEWSERKHATPSDEQSSTATPTATPASNTTATPTATATLAPTPTPTPTPPRHLRHLRREPRWWRSTRQPTETTGIIPKIGCPTNRSIPGAASPPTRADT